MKERRDAPASALDIAYGKKDANKMRAVKITGTGNEVLVKDSGQIVLRRVGRGGPRVTSSRARALKGCKGKRGCEFATCVESALGKMPSKLKASCGSR